jgi:zeaxanthin glucosyltransferase
MRADRKTWRFGVLAFRGIGHLNPLIALSQQLAMRGHNVTFFEHERIADRIRSAGLNFFSLSGAYREKQVRRSGDRASIWQEIGALRFKREHLRREVEHYLEVTPAAIAESGVDALLIDELAITGPTIAQLLGLPYFLLSTSVPHHLGWRSSSWITGFRYSATAISWLQTPLLEVSALRTRGAVRHVLDRFRQSAGFGPIQRIADDYPCLAHITQLPECFSQPHQSPAANFYYSGPWISSAREPFVDFPWDKLDGRPIAYASLGTTHNAQAVILRMIADACHELDLQLVISLGNRFDPEMYRDLPGRPLVTSFAPQLALLKSAALVITHCGANTTLEALMEGKPLVAIPLAYDQPAVADHLRRLKVAEVLPVMRLSTDRIRRAVTRVLRDPGYRRAARRVQLEMGSRPGAKCAADIIEVELSRYPAQRQVGLCTRQRPAGRHEPDRAAAVVSSFDC